MLTQAIINTLESTQQNMIAEIQSDQAATPLPVLSPPSPMPLTHSQNHSQRQLLKLLLPPTAYFYGKIYSGVIARSLFTRVYDALYGIPTFDCGYNLACYGSEAAEYYGWFVPARELAGTYGTQYGPTVFFTLACIAPPLIQLSSHLTIKATRSVYQQALNTGWSLLNLYHSKKETEPKATSPNTQPQTHTVIVFPKIEEYVSHMSQNPFEQDFLETENTPPTAALTQTQQALNLEGTIQSKTGAINLRKSA